jgi:hypothetical protein
MSKEKPAAERPERKRPSNREHVGHVEVEAHGVTNPEFTKDQFKPKHEEPKLETSQGVSQREIKHDKVGERHAVEENGLVTAERRKASVMANRKASEAGIASRRQPHHPCK